MSFRSKMQPFKATLYLESDAQPRLHKPRSVQSSQVSHTVRETHAFVGDLTLTHMNMQISRNFDRSFTLV